MLKNFQLEDLSFQNLQSQLEKIILRDMGKSLLIHSCCAPCSSYVLEYLSKYFSVTLFFYNPNIMPEEEYIRRLEEQKRLIKSMPGLNEVRVISPEYDSKRFLEATKGLEDEPEGGKRCTICYEMRLREAAIAAKNMGADYFTTTLSVSPYKDAKRLNRIALELEEEIGVKRLPSDFKKKGGYQRSIELSKIYDLYRQDWCGCSFSKAERERKASEK